MSFWPQKNVLITGATGFVGFWLTQALVEKGAHVVALVRDHNPQSELYRSGLIHNISVVSGSLESEATLERALCEFSIDTVFHLAAQTIVGTAKKAPLLTFEANIRGTYTLLEACRRHMSTVERIVIASSDKAYGESALLPYTESMPLMGSFPYDVSKSCADLIAQSYFKTYHLPLAITRCGNIFGGGDLNWSRIIPGTIRSLLNNKAPVIRSDGSLIRDYIYVKDVIHAYLLLAENLHKTTVLGESFNFAPAKPATVIEIVRTLQRLIQREELEPVILNQAEGEIRDQFLTCKKAKERLHWSSQYSFEEGLEETVHWYTQFFTPAAYALC